MENIAKGILTFLAIIFHISEMICVRVFKTRRLGFIWRYVSWKRKLGKVGENVKFYKRIIIHEPQYVSIGNNSRIGDYVHLWGGGGIEIGDDVLIAAHTCISSQQHDVNAKLFRLTQYNKKIVIGDNVWIGANVVILPGVTIGENTIIGAGSVVAGDIPANSIAVGSPAKVKNKRKVI